MIVKVFLLSNEIMILFYCFIIPARKRAQLLSNILKGEPEAVEYFLTATPLPHDSGAEVLVPPEFKKELQFINSGLVSFL